MVGYTRIQTELRDAGVHDPGAGSSLAALQRRALIEVDQDMVPVLATVAPRVIVKITPAGRAAVRAALGITAPRRPPAGLMTEWLWDSLAVLYRAGQDGMILSDTYAGRVRTRQQEERTPSWNALLALRDRKDGPFMEEFMPPGAKIGSSGHVRITEQGRVHYIERYEAYRKLYPDVAATAPAWESAPAE